MLQKGDQEICDDQKWLFILETVLIKSIEALLQSAVLVLQQ